MDFSVVAGALATAAFAASTLPMLAKARRTKELASYSVGNIVLADVGNGLYSVYVIHLPPGPVWALHSFHTVSTAMMLFWYVRYAVPAAGPVPAAGSVRVAHRVADAPLAERNHVHPVATTHAAEPF